MEYNDLMTDATEKKPARPPHRDRTVTFRVSKEVYRLAKKRAKYEQRPLAAIIRAWFTKWAEAMQDFDPDVDLNSVSPSPPPEEDEDVRAAWTRRK
jgi:hypothetical protein